MPRFDWPAIGIGMASGAVIILPATLLSSLLIDDGSSSNWAVLFIFATLLGFSFAGFTTGSRISDTPMAHAAVAGFGCWAVVQAIGIGRRLATDADIAWATLPVAAIFAVTFAVAGAVFGDWNQRRIRRNS